MPADLPLPVRPALAEGESLEAYVRRTAARNHCTVKDLLDVQKRMSRFWEEPSSDTLQRLAALTGHTPDTLKAATLPSRYPGAITGGFHLGRRWQGAPAWCPACGPTYDVELRLQALVTCVRCDRLLTDAASHVEAEVDLELVKEQAALRRTLGRQPSTSSRARLRRLQNLMYALSRAITSEWPPLAPGESPSRRAIAVDAQREVGPGHKVHRSPAATAVLLRLSWQLSASGEATRRMLEAARLRAATIVIPEAETTTGLSDLSSLRPEHVPHAFTADVHDILPPRHEIPARSAYSVLLAHLVSGAHAERTSSLSETARGLGFAGGRSIRIVRLAGELRRHPDHHEAVRGIAAVVLRAGPIDYQQRRAELRHRRDIPDRILRQLPHTARHHAEPSRHASAWIWLDATQGVPSGGPHPNLSHATLRAFHQALGPEGRLVLREYWTDQVGQTDAMLAIPEARTSATSPTARGA